MSNNPLQYKDKLGAGKKVTIGNNTGDVISPNERQKYAETLGARPTKGKRNKRSK